MLKVYAPKDKSIEICELEGSGAEVLAQVSELLQYVVEQSTDAGCCFYVLMKAMASRGLTESLNTAIKHYMEDYIEEYEKRHGGKKDES